MEVIAIIVSVVVGAATLIIPVVTYRRTVQLEKEIEELKKDLSETQHYSEYMLHRVQDLEKNMPQQ